MALSDELQRVADLHERGVLDDDEFQRAKAKLLDGGHATLADQLPPVNRLRRSMSDRWLGGVCGGLAELFEIESWIVRLCFAVLVMFAGTGLLLYILLWLFVPEDDTQR